MASTAKREIILQGRIKGVLKQNTPLFVGPVETVGGSVPEGNETVGFVHAEGENVSSFAPMGIAMGTNAVAAHPYAFVWNGDSTTEQLSSEMSGSFTVVPSSKFYIGEKPLPQYYSDFIELTGGNIRGNLVLNGARFTSGLNCTASGRNSVSFGYDSTASGENSHAEGESTVAGGKNSHAEGSNAAAYGENSHAEGLNATVFGDDSYLWSSGEREFTSDRDGTFSLSESSALYIGDDRFDLCYLDGFREHAFESIALNLEDTSFVHTTGDEYGIDGEKVFLGAFDAQNAQDVFVKEGIGINNNNSQLASTEFVKNLFLSFVNKGYVSETESPVPSGVYSNNVKLMVYQNNVATEIQSAPSVKPTSGAFAGCTEMVEFDSTTVDTIGDYAFYGAVSFKNLNVTANVRYVGSHAFDGCSSLEGTFELQYADSIGDHAFSGCTEIETLKFASATSVGSFAFSNCDGLLDIYLGKFTEAELLNKGVFLSNWFHPLVYDYTMERYMVVHAKDRTFAYQKPSHVTLDLNNTDLRKLVTSGTHEFSYLRKNTRYPNYYTTSSCSVKLNTNGTHITPPNLGPAYTFNGYFTSNGTTECIEKDGRILDYVRNTLFGENVLQANWTTNTFTVSLDFNGGSGTSTTVESVVATFSFDMPSLVGTSLPTRYGYLFGGYYDSTEQVGTQYYLHNGASARQWDKTNAATLYAKWNPITHSLTYDYDGGTKGSLNPSTMTYDTWASVSNPSRTGYTFTGWNLLNGDYNHALYRKINGSATTNVRITSNSFLCSPNGTTVNYLQFLNINATNGGSSQLKANWSANSYTVTLTSHEQLYSSGTTSVTATYDRAMPTVASKPIRLGHTFNGYWYGEVGSGIKYYDSSLNSVRDWNIPSDATLYSDWILSSY